MTTGERIKQLRRERGYTLQRLAELVGTSKQTIQRYECGIISNIPPEKIEVLAASLGTSPSVLLGWSELPMTKSDKTNGVAVLNSENAEITDNYTHLDPNADFAIFAKTDALIGNGIFENDIVFIKRKSMPENGKITLFRFEGRAHLRRAFTNGDEIIFNSDSARPPIMQNKNDADIIGTVTAVLHSLD